MEQELVTCIDRNLSLGIGRPLGTMLGFQGQHWQRAGRGVCVLSETVQESPPLTLLLFPR